MTIWTKAKKWIAAAAGAVVAALLALLGIKSRKLKRANKEIEEKKEEIETLEETRKAEMRLEKASRIAEKDTEGKIYAVKEETATRLSESADMEPSGENYNKLVEEWNNGE